MRTALIGNDHGGALILVGPGGSTPGYFTGPLISGFPSIIMSIGYNPSTNGSHFPTQVEELPGLHTDLSLEFLSCALRRVLTSCTLVPSASATESIPVFPTRLSRADLPRNFLRVSEQTSNPNTHAARTRTHEVLSAGTNSANIVGENIGGSGGTPPDTP